MDYKEFLPTNQTLVELTPGFKRELQKMCDDAGIPNSGRFSVLITIKEPSLITEAVNRKDSNGE